MKFLLKWALRLFLLGVVLLVIFFLSLDTILRVIAERNIYAQTGLTAHIGTFHMGLLQPVIQIKDFTIYNPTNYAGTKFITIPEIYVEYDKAALRNDFQIHVNYLRFNLGELDIVKNQQGRTNIFDLGVTVPTKEDLKENKGMDLLKKRTGLVFQGIDSMTVSVGTFNYIDLQQPTNNRTQKIDLVDVPLKNVKTEADLVGLVVFIGLRSDNFFDTLMPSDSSGLGTLKQLGL